MNADKIYVIMGTMSNDRWPVCWRADPEDARIMCNALIKQNEEYNEWFKDYRRVVLRSDNANRWHIELELQREKFMDINHPMHSEDFHCDYVTYSIWGLSEDPRAEYVA